MNGIYDSGLLFGIVTVCVVTVIGIAVLHMLLIWLFATMDLDAQVKAVEKAFKQDASELSGMTADVFFNKQMHLYCPSAYEQQKAQIRELEQLLRQKRHVPRKFLASYRKQLDEMHMQLFEMQDRAERASAYADLRAAVDAKKDGLLLNALDYGRPDEALFTAVSQLTAAEAQTSLEQFEAALGMP